MSRYGGIGVSRQKKKEHNRPDKNVVRKEEEKIAKYSPLALEVRRMHGVSTKIIPIVVGTLCVVTKNLFGYLNDLQVPDVLGGLQTSAIIGTTIILRKVLSICLRKKNIYIYIQYKNTKKTIKLQKNTKK